ncbi:MAG: hypothetical protein HY722_09420 [Planctomycetes bacterium]|nr:hypothetical protein [Planctomycetota bacterium]
MSGASSTRAWTRAWLLPAIAWTAPALAQGVERSELRLEAFRFAPTALVQADHLGVEGSRLAGDLDLFLPAEAEQLAGRLTLEGGEADLILEGSRLSVEGKGSLSRDVRFNAQGWSAGDRLRSRLGREDAAVVVQVNGEEHEGDRLGLQAGVRHARGRVLLESVISGQRAETSLEGSFGVVGVSGRFAVAGPVHGYVEFQYGDTDALGVMEHALYRRVYAGLNLQLGPAMAYAAFEGLEERYSGDAERLELDLEGPVAGVALEF